LHLLANGILIYLEAYLATNPVSIILNTSELLAAFQRISTSLATSKIRICFFIDGLDEYEGRPDDIIKLIEILKFLPHIKMCVSSRPWNEFEKDFGQDDSRKLYMRDLARNDIELYVRDTPGEGPSYQELKKRDYRSLDLVRDIVEAASCVFLCVFLVVRLLLGGLKCIQNCRLAKETSTPSYRPQRVL